MEAKPQTVVIYESQGHPHFTEWADGLGGDEAIILARLEHVENGNFGTCEPVGEGVSELKIDRGPGYRVYFGQHDDIVVLLCGGDKSTQDNDIKKAKKLWREYKASPGE